MKRILYLDTLRGFLILYVIFIHAVLLVIFQADYGYIDMLPAWLIAVMFPMLLIAMWGPMFSMMSATTNTLIVHKQLNTGKPITSVISTRMLSYVLIIIIHFINVLFFIHFLPIDGEIYRSLLCGILETGQITLPNILMFLNSGTLLLIGLSGLLINLILFIIWKKNKHRNLKKTAIIFLVLSILFLAIRPFIYPIMEQFILDLANHNQYLPAILLSWLFRGQFGLIPMAAIPFFGVIFGLLLAGNANKHTVKKVGFGLSFLMLLCAGLFIGLFGIPDLTLPYWPVQMVAINLMIMTLVTTILILRFEFANKQLQHKQIKRTIFLRRFSMITLTIFVFESIISVLWANIFTFLFTDPFPFNVLADFLFVLCVLITWYIIVRAWEKIDFKYSIEWWMMKIIGRITGKKSGKLDVQSVLYHPIEPKNKEKQ